MASARPTAFHHWARIIQRWPIDKVRPVNVSFETVMKQRLKNATSTAPPVANVKANEALVSANQPTFTEQEELRQANALYLLLEDGLQKRYAMPPFLRRPASNPTHYDDLVTEMMEAPSRSWFGALTKRIKGSLRFS